MHFQLDRIVWERASKGGGWALLSSLLHSSSSSGGGGSALKSPDPPSASASGLHRMGSGAKGGGVDVHHQGDAEGWEGEGLVGGHSGWDSVVVGGGIALCRHWSATGACKYGSGCHFSHQ